MNPIKDNRYIQLVDSPDDGGYYFGVYVWDGNKDHPGHIEYSEEVYPTRAAAFSALRRGKVTWELFISAIFALMIIFQGCTPLF